MLQSTIVCILAGISAAAATAADDSPWWNAKWQFRTTVTRSAPYRDSSVRPVEVAVDFARLIECRPTAEQNVGVGGLGAGWGALAALGCMHRGILLRGSVGETWEDVNPEWWQGGRIWVDRGRVAW